MGYVGTAKALLEKEKAEVGDTIEISKEGADTRYLGILMPHHEFSGDDIVTIKLKSGYNVGIAVDKRTTLRVIEKAKKSEKKEKGEGEGHDGSKKTSAKKEIAILHTGGTIASKVDYRTGGVIASYTPEDLLRAFPELRAIASIRSRLIANMWSDDMRFGHYNLIANEIKKEVEAGVDGIVVSHGTDTLGYSAAALAFILCDVSVPVILVGAQRSSDRGSSDAGVNMICATEFIAETDFAGVAVCMHENMSDDTCVILPACKTRKMHTSRRDAFKAINASPIARVNFHTKNIEFFDPDYKRKTAARVMEIMPIRENIKVGVVKIHTNMYPEEFSCYKKFEGLVIEGTGLGHTPAHVTDDATKIHEKILAEIKALVDAGVTVAMAPQTIFGRVNMNVYNKGRDLQKAGVLGDGTDMIPETAFIKLAWLLSNYDAPNVKKLYAVNLRGEISERSGDEFLD